MRTVLRSIAVLMTVLIVVPAHALTWKSIFIAGDNSIENFDNGREDLLRMFAGMGTVASLQLSSSRNKISEERRVYPATLDNIARAFASLQVQPGEGCFVHMTSHGLKNHGFYLALGGVLTPAHLAELVNQKCGSAPTVILVSACYSGQFVTDELKGPNRVILTAASAERPSFGCSPDTRYTYWDGCLLRETPKARTWEEVYSKVVSCIRGKEAAAGVPSSFPQSFFGVNARNWPVLH